MDDDEERIRIAVDLVFRIRIGSMPPDDAYWWGRYLACGRSDTTRPHVPPLTHRMALPCVSS